MTAISNSDMLVTIFGASGFIGSRALRLRLSSGCEQPALKLAIVE